MDKKDKIFDMDAIRREREIIANRQKEIDTAIYKAIRSISNNILEAIEREKQDRINRKWQRIFIALIITNIIIYSQII